MEHIGRGTAQGVDAFIIVVEPGKRSVQTAEAIDKLAQELKVSCYVVGSKVTSDADRQFIIDSLPRFEVLGFMSYNAKVREADLKGMSVYDAAPDVVEEVKTIKQKLEQKEAERSI
jgi:CO dehydrogenase maturation factor